MKAPMTFSCNSIEREKQIVLRAKRLPFFIRYYEDIFNGTIDDIYHKIYSKISDGFNQDKSVGVNWVIPPSRLYELEHFHRFGFKKKPSPTELLQYVASDFGVQI